ncbi:ArnT family glycosyltransferase [Halochromatium roseum]|uniref:ArnT family glycosyltransferase n=1 Tax=Halochromatium roseum TaxID=391920 RepID=UPI0019116004|nr:glycosyltransferase family 39 protein [Halochromatium roseum]MBK5940205.1 hypothetical protein [Halochromatium roseum]
MHERFFTAISNHRERLLIASLFLLALVPLFINLGAIPIQVWDESRLAINAYEMYSNGDWLVTSFAGAPDLWNTKPPMLIWLQAAFMHLIGPSEWAVRLPSAIAGTATAALLLIFCMRYLGQLTPSLIAMMVLVTTWGYVDIHVTRTGDYDALLVLFTTASALAFFAFCETGRDRYLLAFFIALTLAVMTKSVSGLFLVPGLALYALLRKQVLTLLLRPSLYLGMLGFIAVVSSYYLAREMHHPGYLDAVLENELFGRYFEVIETHQGDLLTYLKRMIKVDYTYWLGFLPLATLFGLVANDPRIRRLTLFSLLMLASLFLLISTAGTKLPWYSAPAYPFMALLVAMFLYGCLQVLERRLEAAPQLVRSTLPTAVITAMIAMPYGMILHKTLFPESRIYSGEEDNYYAISLLLKEAVDGERDLRGAEVLYDGYAAHQAFYAQVLADRGHDVTLGDWLAPRSGSLVIASQDHVIGSLTGAFEWALVGEDQGAKLLLLSEAKSSDLAAATEEPVKADRSAAIVSLSEARQRAGAEVASPEL